MSGEHGASADYYAAVLADLQRKRDEIDRTMASLRALAGLPSGSPPPSGGPAPSGHHDGETVTISRHEFVGKSTPEAVKMYLGKIGKRLAGPREISEALVAGGLGEDADAVYVNVYSALKRMRDTEVVKNRTEWGLAETFPSLIGKGRKKKGAVEVEDDSEDEGETSEPTTPPGDTTAA
jgi:hypothetical protein